MPLLSTILQATGISIIAFSLGLIFLPAGIAVAGIGVLLFGLALERRSK
jgi:hypothetical protein